MILIDAKEFRDMLYSHFEFLQVNETEVWCVVDVDEVLDHIPEIEAIPIEWIEKYLTPFRERYEKIRDEWKPTSSAGWVIDVIEDLLKEWRKKKWLRKD